MLREPRAGVASMKEPYPRVNANFMRPETHTMLESFLKIKMTKLD